MSTARFRVSLGQAVQAQQAIAVCSILVLCYLLANPELAPGFAQPLLASVRNSIAVALNALLAGWWPIVAGKLFLAAAAAFVVRQLIHVRLEKKEARVEERKEKDNAERMRRAREEAQRKLQELAEEQRREELCAAIQATLCTAAVSVAPELEASKEAGLAQSREKAQGKHLAAAASSQGAWSKEQGLDAASARAQDKSGGSSKDASTSTSQRQRQYIEQIQSQLDSAVARTAASAPSGEAAAAVAGVLPDGPEPLPAAGPSDRPRQAQQVAGAAAVQLAGGGPAGSGPAPGPAPGGSAGALKPSTSSSSLHRSRANGSSGAMIPLAVAQEAAERQQHWLQQLQEELDLPKTLQAAALESDRLLRQEQDLEYQQALDADRQQLQRAEEAKRSAAQREEELRSQEAESRARQQSLKQSREEVRAALALSEPPAGSEGVVQVRVRLPGGQTQQRRFAGDAAVSQVSQWVCCLEEMPLTPDAAWRLVTSYPRVVLEEDCSLQEVAAGAAAVALFVEAA